MKYCPQCKHPEHTALMETRKGKWFTFSGGCPIVVALKPLKKGGYYHEHCDCDYDMAMKEEL